MSDPVEFSEFYKLLNAAKEGEEGKATLLKAKLNEYEKELEAASHLDELGKIFLAIGVKELFKYSNCEDMKIIGNFDKESWEKIAEAKKEQLPQFLANTMISHAKANDLPKTIANKWNISRREMNKHIRPMARYITEGIIDVLE